MHVYARRLADIYQRIAPVAEIREIRMSAVASVAGFIKKHVLGQTLIRRNPFYYDRACADARRKSKRSDCDGRRAWVERAGRAHARSSRSDTDYGTLGARWRRSSTSWPLLDKELLRHRLQAFTTGNEWLSAPATTGGTSGVPLKVVRRSRPSCSSRPASIA